MQATIQVGSGTCLRTDSGDLWVKQDDLSQTVMVALHGWSAVYTLILTEEQARELQRAISWPVRPSETDAKVRSPSTRAALAATVDTVYDNARGKGCSRAWL